MAQLRDLRQQAGKTQEQTAADLNMGLRTIIRHERGTTPLSGLHRIAYATYYGVAPESIEQPKPKKPKRERRAP